MNCKNCGKLIPNQSLFCPYCGASSPAMQESAAPISSYVPQSQSVSDKMKGKVKTCPRCGTLLGKREKVCSVCGEVMPKPKKSHKAKTAIISMSVVICLLLCSTVYFMLEMFQGNRAIDELTDELTAEVTSRHNKIDFYEQHVALIEIGKDYYHSYGCPYLETPSTINIYSKETARNRGFYPCRYCQ